MTDENCRLQIADSEEINELSIRNPALKSAL